MLRNIRTFSTHRQKLCEQYRKDVLKLDQDIKKLELGMNLIISGLIGFGTGSYIIAPMLRNGSDDRLGLFPLII